jgi:hypothetical protein
MLATMETHTGPQEDTHTFLTENTNDALGNQLADSRKGLEFSYNLANLPESVEGTDGASLTYSYPPFGTRIPGSIQVADNRHRFGGKEERRYGN